MFNTEEENFLKKVFLPPYPHLSKTLKLGGYFFTIISALDGQTTYVRTVPECESFGAVQTHHFQTSSALIMPPTFQDS